MDLVGQSSPDSFPVAFSLKVTVQGAPRESVKIDDSGCIESSSSWCSGMKSSGPSYLFIKQALIVGIGRLYLTESGKFLVNSVFCSLSTFSRIGFMISGSGSALMPSDPGYLYSDPRSRTFLPLTVSKDSRLLR